MALEPMHKESRDVTADPALDQRVTEPSTTHAAPAVDADRLFVGRTVDFHRVGGVMKDPDESPLNWTNARSAPPTPFELFDCTAKGDAPPRVAQAPQSRRVSEPSPPVHHTSHHRPDKGLLSESELPDFSNDRREKYWSAFKSVSAQAQAHHGVMGARLDAFRHAEGDPALAQLGYLLPSKSWEGNLSDLTDKQKVPLQNGVTVGSLFDGDNNLRLDKHDEHAIDGAGAAMKKGKGTIETKVLDTLIADATLKVRVAAIQSQLDTLRAAAESVQSAALDITAYTAKEEVIEAQAQIDSLKADASEAKEVVDVVFGLVTSVVYGATGEIGDAINQIGVVAGTLLNHVNDTRIAAAMVKLTRANQRHSAASSVALGKRLQAARHNLLAEHGQLDAAGKHLYVALSVRRKAYNDLAFAAGEEIPCPERNRHKIAGMLAAIPLVEMVVSRARTLGSMSSPSYNQAAGRGLGMAAFHGLPISDAFRRACGELNFNRMSARLVEGEWTERLQALLDVKTRIAGPRPG